MLARFSPNEIIGVTLKNMKLKIPWDEYSEEEVQAVLKLYFESLGYKVDWLHMEDRRMEEGIDLLCKKPKESIGITVKRKPVSRDYGQLIKLANSKCRRKIYVYVYKPTPTFRKKAGRYKKRVEFWNPRSIEKTFQTTQVGLCLLYDLYFSNSPFAEEVAKFLTELRSLVKNKKEVPMQSFPMKKVGGLWQLKDAVVSMHKSLELLLEIFEDETIMSNINEMTIFRIFLITLERLTFNMHKFIDLWKKTTRGNSLLFGAYEKFGDRSNWYNLWVQESDLQEVLIFRPSIMWENLDKLGKIEEKAFEDIENKFAELIEKNGRHYQRRTMFLYVITNSFLRANYALMLNLEGVVDQLFDVLRTQRFV